MPPQIENNQNTVTEPKSNKLLIFFGFLAAALVLVYLSVAVYARYFRKPILNMPVPQQTDLSSWQTYRNEEYGFEMKVPNEWKTDVQKGTIHLFYAPGSEMQILTFVAINPEVEITYPPKLNLKNVKWGDLEWKRYEDYGGYINYEYAQADSILHFSSKNEIALEQVLSTFKFIK